MKRTVTILIAVLIGILSLSSCSTMLPSRFESFSEGVENNGENYNLKKWERKNKKFKDLCAEYKENFSLYSSSERRKINNAIVKYVKAAGKSGIITVTDAVDEVVDQVKSLAEDVKSFWEELGLKKKGK